MPAIFHPLQPGVTVIERGWLNCNQIVLTASTGGVLIDSGYGRHATQTLAAVAQALNGAPLAQLINTHCHSDHMGGNRALRERYGCRVTIPAGEVRHIVPWTAQSCWSAQMDQYAEEFRFDDTIDAGDMFAGAGLQWEAIAAPGHDMDALMFWCAELRILITGDALWERGMGFVFPGDSPGAHGAIGSNVFIDAAFSTLDAIEALNPRLVIPGHGAPFGDVAAALSVARSRLKALAADPARNARNVVKGLFVFALLDKGSMPVDELPAYLARVPVYGELSERFLHLDFEALAEAMLSDLLKIGALRIDEGRMRPTMRA
ncbi:MAG TPA: MBL fold metallo-hydrolase [Usitatibacteraceae bacterium]